MKKKTEKSTAEIVFKLKRTLPSEVFFSGPLNVWARNPHSFAVVKESAFTKVHAYHLTNCHWIKIVRAPKGGKTLTRKLCEIIEESNNNHSQHHPLLLVVPHGVEASPAWEMVKNRAALIVEL